MAQNTNLIEIPAFFSGRIKKNIIFNASGLKIEKTRSFDFPVEIANEDIVSFRYGVNWITGYQFTIGRQYVIELLDTKKQVTSIKLTSYYQVKRKRYYQLYADIINRLWANYFAEKLNDYYDLYKKKAEFKVSDVNFHPFGISWYDGGIFCNDIALRNYFTYFMINKTDDLNKPKRCSFKNDWDALLLQVLLKKIIEEQDAYLKAAN